MSFDIPIILLLIHSVSTLCCCFSITSIALLNNTKDRQWEKPYNCLFLKESVGNLMRLLFDLRWLLFKAEIQGVVKLCWQRKVESEQKFNSIEILDLFKNNFCAWHVYRWSDANGLIFLKRVAFIFSYKSFFFLFSLLDGLSYNDNYPSHIAL